MKTLFVVVLMLVAVGAAFGQTKKVPCWPWEPEPFSCTYSQRLAKANALAKARTAAIVIDARREIACGDGSDGSCLAKDYNAVTTIENEIKKSPLWSRFNSAAATNADILLKFDTLNTNQLQLCAYNADSNEVLWCDLRSVVALDNDAAREIAHFLLACSDTRQGRKEGTLDAAPHLAGQR